MRPLSLGDTRSIRFAVELGHGLGEAVRGANRAALQVGEGGLDVKGGNQFVASVDFLLPTRGRASYLDHLGCDAKVFVQSGRLVKACRNFHQDDLEPRLFHDTEPVSAFRQRFYTGSLEIAEISGVVDVVVRVKLVEADSYLEVVRHHPSLRRPVVPSAFEQTAGWNRRYGKGGAL